MDSDPKHCLQVFLYLGWPKSLAWPQCWTRSPGQPRRRSRWSGRTGFEVPPPQALLSACIKKTFQRFFLSLDKDKYWGNKMHITALATITSLLPVNKLSLRTEKLFYLLTVPYSDFCKNKKHIRSKSKVPVLKSTYVLKWITYPNFAEKTRNKKGFFCRDIKCCVITVNIRTF